MGNARQVPTLLAPENCAVLFVDFEPQMLFAVHSIDGQELVNNAAALAKTARLFNVPVVLTTVAEKTFSGPTFPQISQVFPEAAIIDRTTMNSWEDPRFVRAVENTGRQKLVFAGLWTEVCVALPVLDALRYGYEAYVVADACGGASATAHDMALQRMIQAGATPITWLQFLAELQRDWARRETYDGVLSIVKEHTGAYGQGVFYAETMLDRHAKEAVSGLARRAREPVLNWASPDFGAT